MDPCQSVLDNKVIHVQYLDISFKVGKITIIILLVITVFVDIIAVILSDVAINLIKSFFPILVLLVVGMCLSSRRLDSLDSTICIILVDR